MSQALRITTAAAAFALSAALALGGAFAYGNNDNPAILRPHHLRCARSFRAALTRRAFPGLASSAGAPRR